MVRAVVLAGALLLHPGIGAAQTAPENPQTPAYSPWAKMCLKAIDETRNCFTGTSLRTICEPLAAAVLVSKQDGPNTLRVTVPMRVARESGTRIAIDDDHPLTQPIVTCLASGCVSDYAADAGLVARLRQGTKLVVEAVGAENQPLRFTLPLAGLAQALDGPSIDPRVVEMSAKERQQLAARSQDANCAR